MLQIKPTPAKINFQELSEHDSIIAMTQCTKETTP